jgi:hypothetical protein
LILLITFVLTSLPSLLGLGDIYNLSFVAAPVVASYLLLRPARSGSVAAP